MPRKDGHYVILSQKSPTTFVIASCDKPDEPLGAYHVSALTPFQNVIQNQSPVVPLRRRGSPPKQPSVSNEIPGKNAKISKITPPRRDGLRRCRGEDVTVTIHCLPLSMVGGAPGAMFFP
ncbi:hypothetical protein AVEN_239953-1 [Araneus ventricosus]|uniref:Uncharacterized protein n=1 Tax=Araneus ventricosus TaxID=182803 RepID=A0A4Y2VEP2_ARAVE|nr:hypothetical protein AVEN_239953-1 [Araneus ventricosus]